MSAGGGKGLEKKELKPHSSLRFVDRNPHRSYFPDKGTPVDRQFMHTSKNFDAEFFLFSFSFFFFFLPLPTSLAVDRNQSRRVNKKSAFENIRLRRKFLRRRLVRERLIDARLDRRDISYLLLTGDEIQSQGRCFLFHRY